MNVCKKKKKYSPSFGLNHRTFHFSFSWHKLRCWIVTKYTPTTSQRLEFLRKVFVFQSISAVCDFFFHKKSKLFIGSEVVMFSHSCTFVHKTSNRFQQHMVAVSEYSYYYCFIIIIAAAASRVRICAYVICDGGEASGVHNSYALFYVFQIHALPGGVVLSLHEKFTRAARHWGESWVAVILVFAVGHTLHTLPALFHFYRFQQFTILLNPFGRLSTANSCVINSYYFHVSFECL